MKKSLLTTTTTALFLCTAFISCTKEKIEEPRQEEQPTTINQGNGIMESVQKGPNGGNVVFSNWITKTEANWVGFGTTEIKTEFNTTSLTEAMKNQGLVLVYLEFPNGSVYHLPYVKLEYQQVIDYTFITGKITVAIKMINNGAITGVADLRFRYILIPASTCPGAGNGRISSPIDFSDYNAVCRYYGISK